ncbi:50S ribosomal protein L6 [candidate division WOR-3 bacterium RBG_13_43_14]|uniref:50S ribosomal protein L6 n=1 Tax=candidate division WOR-3 bacterium RBG_13_43_14 TaxID=1802590 RepID=A0A1F4UE16_UNCW3|nr:MAG: 50S ribosomal protein L6 [candidate division WOR-3 bacterium RBG_13_43_14]
MARQRFRPITIPKQVKVTRANSDIKVQGPLGTVEGKLSSKVDIEIQTDQILVKSIENSKAGAAEQGTTRSLIINMIKGVTLGYEKILIIQGTGYRAQLAGNNIQLFVGYSSPVSLELPKEIKCELKVVKSADKGDLTYITLKSINKQLLGDVAAKIKRVRIPDPYRHKGIRYEKEHLRKKIGKRAIVQA